MRQASLVFRGVVLLVLFSPAPLPAQGSKLLEVRSADVLNVRYVGNQEVRELIGNVHIVQTSPVEVVKIWCDSALRYMAVNKLELYGRVRIVRDSVTLLAPEAVYFGNEQRSEMKHGVRLLKGSMVLTASFGEYFTEEKRARFMDDVRVVDASSLTTANTLLFFEGEEKSIALGNVRVINTENHLTVYGDSLVNFDRLNYAVVSGNPRMVQVDTASDGRIDTLVVVSEVMESFRDSLQQFIARGNVAMARTDFSARCGEAIYRMEQDRMILRERPVVWHEGNQVSGDSIVVTLLEKRLHSVYVKGRAMAVSMADSTTARRFDQLTGREIVMQFAGNKLERIEAERNAVSMYYLFEEHVPNGANRSSGDRIVIEFDEGKTDRIRIVGGVEGRYFPEPMIEGREMLYNLDGFRWISNRPKRERLEIVSAEH
ncbi:MAG: OstA-like protein [Bacteroidota bacterium]